mgnify:CR=1 FL=1
MKRRLLSKILFSAILLILLFVIFFTLQIHRYIFLLIITIISAISISMIVLHRKNVCKLYFSDYFAYLNLYDDLNMYYQERENLAEKYSSFDIDEQIDNITGKIILTEKILIMLYENYFIVYEKTLKRFLPLYALEEIELIYKEASALLEDENLYSSFL